MTGSTDTPEGFAYSDMLPVGPDTTQYRLLSTEGDSTFEDE